VYHRSHRSSIIMSFADDEGHKVLIIGPAKAGKTTFITRYVHGVYGNNDYKQTFGGKFKICSCLLTICWSLHLVCEVMILDAAASVYLYIAIESLALTALHV